MLPRVISVVASLALIVGVAGCGGDGVYDYRIVGDGSGPTASIAKPAWWDNPVVLYCDDPRVGAWDYVGNDTGDQFSDSYCKISGP